MKKNVNGNEEKKSIYEISGVFYSLHALFEKYITIVFLMFI
jgi:hypothetical protein